MKNKIPYGRQEVVQADIDAVTKVLRSDFLTQGDVVPQFEIAISDKCNARYGIAVNSATSALHIACLALGVQKGDEVWTSPNSFVASANCAIYCGANVDFVDIDLETYNISIKKLREKLASAAIIGKLPKVVIPVHFSGQSCDMFEIYQLSKQYGFKILEDASHGIGGSYMGKKIGSCEFSDITVFSFHPVKIITTGEGGMAVTNDENLNHSMRLFRSHGISSSKEEMFSRPNSEIWNYQQICLGFNYRMTDIQAALGLSQLNRIDEIVKTRNALAEKYNDMFSSLNIVTPKIELSCHSSFHLYVIQLCFEKIKATQREIFDRLHKAGIMVNLHYIPIYLQPYYSSLGFNRGYCENAEYYYSRTLSIPIYPGLTQAQQTRVIDEITKAIK